MTLTELQTAIGDFLSTSTGRLSTANRTLLVNLSRRYLTRQFDLRVGETSATFNTVASTKSYALPTGYSRPLQLWYVSPSTGERIQVNPIDQKAEFDNLYPSPTTVLGLPIDFTVWGTNFQLGPTPDQIVTVNVDYYKTPADFTAGADHDDLTDNYWEAVLFRALAEASRYMIEDERAPMWEERARFFEGQLVQEQSRARFSAGRIVSEEP